MRGHKAVHKAAVIRMMGEADRADALRRAAADLVRALEAMPLLEAQVRSLVGREYGHVKKLIAPREKS